MKEVLNASEGRRQRLYFIREDVTFEGLKLTYTRQDDFFVVTVQSIVTRVKFIAVEVDKKTEKATKEYSASWQGDRSLEVLKTKILSYSLL